MPRSGVKECFEQPLMLWTIGVYYPSQCASLQREILEDAVTMLAVGVGLVYSTCTWAPPRKKKRLSIGLEEFMILTCCQ